MDTLILYSTAPCSCRSNLNVNNHPVLTIIPSLHYLSPLSPCRTKTVGKFRAQKHKMTKFGLPLDFTGRGADRRSPLFHSALFLRDFKRLIFSYYDVIKQLLSRKSRVNVCRRCMNSVCIVIESFINLDQDLSDIVNFFG